MRTRIVSTAARHRRSIAVVVTIAVAIAVGWLMDARFDRIEAEIGRLQAAQSGTSGWLIEAEPEPEPTYAELVAEARKRLALRGHNTPSPGQIDSELDSMRNEAFMRDLLPHRR
ncbi:MAG: hypothetical protein OXC31_20345 [Spirochaetaceae bacterium]|nr:hypothetical protein [Spirochaetaceae bacterium]